MLLFVLLYFLSFFSFFIYFSFKKNLFKFTNPEKDYLIDNLKTENVYKEKKNKNLENKRSFLSLKNNNRKEKSNNKIISILKILKNNI